MITNAGIFFDFIVIKDRPNDSFLSVFYYR